MKREKLIKCLQAMPAGLEIYCDDPQETGGAVTFDTIPQVKTIYVYRSVDGLYGDWFSIEKVEGLEPVRTFQGIVFV